MEKFLKGENKQSNKCLKQKTSMITKLNINTRIKKKRKWGVLTLHRQDSERQKGGGVKNGDGLSMIWITDLEYAGSVWSPPGIQEVVLASADEPLAAVGELEGEDTALVEVELVLVRLTAVEYLHITALHSKKKVINF